MYPPVRRDFPIEDWSEEKKEAVLEKAVEALARSQTGYRRQAHCQPKDFPQEQFELYRGAVYGLSPQVAPGNHFPHSRTPIQGLYQTGQTTYPGYSVDEPPHLAFSLRKR